MRNTTLWIATTILSLVSVASVGAKELTSTTETFPSAGSSVFFDVTGDPDFATLNLTDVLIKIRVDWLLTPGGAQTIPVNLIGSLYLDGYSHPELDLDATVGPGGTVYAHSEFYAENGLTYTQHIVDSLLSDGSPGVISGTLYDGNGTLNSFIGDGGTVQGFLTLTFIEQPGGSSEVPEPASLLVWSGLAGAGLVYRRRQKKNALAKS